eukprot:3498787-Ditylum_brightwellii.AAC.1
MALIYHPDVVINSQSTVEEKIKANDNFARINNAYESLKSGGFTGSPPSGGEKSSSYKSSTTPPHRRTSTTGSSRGSRSYTGSASTDWRDYMPRNDDDDAKYDTG